MFQGATELSLDAKGRLAVPTRHREALVSAGAVVLTAHPDGCLLLYPQLAWEPIGSRVQALPSFDARTRWWQRLLVGHAEEIVPDAQGRILISPALRKRAGLAKNVMLIGQGSHFEIWDADLWEEKLAQAMGEAGSALPLGGENFSL